MKTRRHRIPMRLHTQRARQVLLGGMPSVKQTRKTIPKMAASQQHGHDFDNEVKAIYKVNGIGYTDVHDIPPEFNNGVPASVKSSVGNTCDCGDATRMYDNTCLPCYQMIRGRYQQVGDKKHLKEVTHVDLSNTKKLMWGDLTKDDVKRLSDLTKTYRPGREDIRKSVHQLKAELNKKSGLMKFRPKMDSKQARLQVSIPKWDEFIKTNPSRVIEHSTTGKFKGEQLTQVRDSPKRTRKTKTKQN